MENHDEQRLANNQFAGDAWKGLPAMVVSATIDQGPVMIYFGQEVGESGLGTEGFGGDDGRTTMFDYWGVPEHQKWVNKGTFDGGGLSMEQKQLREFYGELLRLSVTNKAIANGEYADLTEFNLNQKNISDKVVAYLRYWGEERLLIVVSFQTKIESIKLTIPKEMVMRIGLSASAIYSGRDILGSGLDIGFDNEFSTVFEIPAFTGLVLKIK